MLINYDIGLSPKNEVPSIVSHVESKIYERIEKKINGSFTGGFYYAELIHELVPDCDQFNYLIFVLTPVIAFQVVLRIAYVWKTTRGLDSYSPGRFFKG